MLRLLIGTKVILTLFLYRRQTLVGSFPTITTTTTTSSFSQNQEEDSVCIDSLSSSSETTTKIQMTEAVPRSESSGVLQRWTDRWSKNNIGWHKDEAHDALLKYLPTIMDSSFDSSRKLRVLVPLCGKTQDLNYLANHPMIEEVVGIEGVQKAIADFAEEHPNLHLDMNQGTSFHSHFIKYKGTKISIWKGDLFDLQQIEIPDQDKFDLVWDRASIVAVQPIKRQEYVQSISSVLKPGAVMLFGTVDRREGTEEAKMSGPPFTVTTNQLHFLYKDIIETGELLQEHDEIALDPVSNQRYVDAGLTSFFEVITLIRTKKA